MLRDTKNDWRFVRALVAVANIVLEELVVERNRAVRSGADRGLVYGTWALVLVTCVLAGFTLMAVIDNRNALDRSHRAWVVPRGAVLEKPLADGQSPEVLLHFDNSGHEPALEMRLTAEPSIVAVSPINVTEAEAAAIADRLCADATSMASSRAVYPRGEEPAYEVRPDFEKYVVSGPALDDRHWFVLRGCFVYKATGEMRRTTFCYFHTATIAAGRPLRNCPYGDFAN